MMIGALRVGHESIDKGNGLWKSLEGELLADRLAVESPSIQHLDLLVNLRLRKKRHGCLPTNRTCPVSRAPAQVHAGHPARDPRRALPSAVRAARRSGNGPPRSRRRALLT